MTTKFKISKPGTVKLKKGSSPVGSQTGIKKFQACGCLQDDKKGIILQVHVQPRATQDSLNGIYGQSVKIRITAPPVDGKANNHIKKYLAQLFQVPKTSVELLQGCKSRRKRYLIRGVLVQEAEEILTKAL